MNIAKKIEAGANVATIVLAGLFGWAVVHGGFRPLTATASSISGSARKPTGAQAGTDLKRSPLKDVNFAGNKQTLVLGLQTTCHFCTESGPFFQKLHDAAAGNVKLVAVLPQTVEESKQYLTKLGVRVDEIRSSPLDAVGVNGTPTLLLADDKGIVKKVWVGKLPDNGQAEVLSAISTRASARFGGLYV